MKIDLSPLLLKLILLFSFLNITSAISGEKLNYSPLICYGGGNGGNHYLIALTKKKADSIMAANMGGRVCTKQDLDRAKAEWVERTRHFCDPSSSGYNKSMCPWFKRVSSEVSNATIQSNNSGQMTSSRNANSQGCTPLPTKCQHATNNAMRLVNKANSGYISGITDSASVQYCTYLIGIKVNNLCAVEYQNVGKYGCADLSRRQSAAYINALPQIASVVTSSSARQARNKCSFE